MENLSHALFSASIIHPLFGKKYGRKAIIFALFAGNIPDLDFVVRFIPGLSQLEASLFHRTMTHSLLFVLVMAPLLGMLMSRIYTSNSHSPHNISGSSNRTFSSRKDWMLITGLAMLSHIFLDWCTTYGVWFLWPFLDRGFEARIISVVDLFFTLPLLGMVIWYLRGRIVDTTKRFARWIAIVFAGGYLLCCTLLTYHTRSLVSHDMTLGQYGYDRISVFATFLQPFMRYVIVTLHDGTYKTAYVSVFDRGPRTYRTVDGKHGCVPVLRRDSVAAHILKRTHGYFTCSAQGTGYKLVDMRFDSLLGRETPQPKTPSPFVYEIDPTSLPYRIEQSHRHMENDISLGDIRQRFWKRVWGATT